MIGGIIGCILICSSSAYLAVGIAKKESLEFDDKLAILFWLIVFSISFQIMASALAKLMKGV